MLDNLLKKGVTQLLELKRPKEVRGTADPNIAGITGWSVTPLKNTPRLRRISCGLLKMG